MIFNDLCPEIRIDPQTYRVQINCEMTPSASLTTTASSIASPLSAQSDFNSKSGDRESDHRSRQRVRRDDSTAESNIALPDDTLRVEEEEAKIISPIYQSDLYDRNVKTIHPIEDEVEVVRSASECSGASAVWVTLECEPAEILPLAQRYLLF